VLVTSVKRSAESRELKAESREQRAESRGVLNVRVERHVRDKRELREQGL
jgi:hypothetical protein